VRPRRPPSLPLFCKILSDHASFSVLRQTPMTATLIQFQSVKRLLQREFLKDVLQGLGLLIELDQNPIGLLDSLIDLSPQILA